MMIKLVPIDNEVSIGDLEDLYTYITSEFKTEDLHFNFELGALCFKMSSDQCERFVREWTFTPHVRLFPVLIRI